MKVILYNSPSGLKMICPNESMDINMVADKDVLAGLSYKIYNKSDLPDIKYFKSWVCNIDSNNRDGVGLTQQEFNTKYPKYKWMTSL